MKRTFFLVVAVVSTFLSSELVQAQINGDLAPPVNDEPVFTSTELQQLAGPVALYPDPLLAIILQAATYPSQIVLADRYLQGGGDASQVDQMPWDPSVQGLAHYPSVLKWMDDNLDWTTQLGQAYQNQTQDLMDAIQYLRKVAYNLGNLQSTPQQQVIDDNGYIEILPIDSESLYVPYYQPDVIYSQVPDGSPYITFSGGASIGVWLNRDLDWKRHNAVVWSQDRPRPTDWWQKSSAERNAEARGNLISSSHTSSAHGTYGGDRGWGLTTPSVPSNVQHQSPSTSAVPQATLVPGEHGSSMQPNVPGTIQPHSIVPQHFQPPQPTSRPQEPAPALAGIQSTHEAQSFSERGQQSLQAMSHSSPPAQTHPPSPSHPSSSSGGASANSGKKH